MLCEDYWRPRSPGVLHRYRVYGLTLASELRHSLPDDPREGSGGATVELRAARPHVFRRLADKLQGNPNDWVHQEILEDGSLYVRWEEWLELLVSSDGTLVLCGNRSNVALESFDAYLTNFAVSAALLQQGEEPLHATVVEIGDRAVGLLGPSGAGKSTLAAHLINRGGNLVTDDMLRVTFEGNTALAHPGPCRLKLFKEPAERYMRNAVCSGPFNPVHGGLVNRLNDKLIFQPCGTAVRSARRLSALFHLDQPFNETESSRTAGPLTGQDLFRTIASSTMNSRHNSPARLHRQFHFAERLARTVPVYRLAYRRCYEVLNNVADRIYQTVPQ
jgi:HPr Serine kinase C-terminal domain